MGNQSSCLIPLVIISNMFAASKMKFRCSSSAELMKTDSLSRTLYSLMTSLTEFEFLSMHKMFESVVMLSTRVPTRDEKKVSDCFISLSISAIVLM